MILFYQKGDVKMMKSTFFERFNLALELRKISPAELSRKTGIDEAAISNYRNGKYKAKQDKLYLISQALRVSPVWLMGYDVPMVDKVTSDDTSIPQNRQELIDDLLNMSDEDFEKYAQLHQMIKSMTNKD